MARILVAYETHEGQTRRIADRVAAVLRDRGDDVDVVELAHAPSPEAYDGVVLGDAIRLGRPDTSRDYEYTDWDAVKHFADDVHALVAAGTHRD
ncbi:MAG: flavodoxin domain-containing protein [Acidimicrobiia bacterium]